MMRVARILTCSPCGILDPRVVVAGSRAGALGVLDPGFRVLAPTVVDAVARIGGLLRGRRFGVRLRSETVESSFLEAAPKNLAVVVVAGREGSDWAHLHTTICR